MVDRMCAVLAVRRVGKRLSISSELRDHGLTIIKNKRFRFKRRYADSQYINRGYQTKAWHTRFLYKAKYVACRG